MIERNRRGLSAEQKAELWKRWKAGQSLNEIGRARRHLPWNRQWLRDASHRTRSASLSLHHQPGDHPPWWAHAVSRQRSRSAGLAVSHAAQAVLAGHAQRAATDGCE